MIRKLNTANKTCCIVSRMRNSNYDEQGKPTHYAFAWIDMPFKRVIIGPRRRFIRININLCFVVVSVKWNKKVTFCQVRTQAFQVPPRCRSTNYKIIILISLKTVFVCFSLDRIFIKDILQSAIVLLGILHIRHSYYILYPMS